MSKQAFPSRIAHSDDYETGISQRLYIATQIAAGMDINKISDKHGDYHIAIRAFAITDDLILFEKANPVEE